MNRRSLPDGWSLKKIGEIATVVSGGTPERNQPHLLGEWKYSLGNSN